MSLLLSSREAIVTQILSVVSALPDFTTVVRRIPLYEKMVNFAITQFPVAAIVAGLPEPDEKESARFQPQHDLIVSDMNVGIICYLMDDDKDTMDSSISTLLNALWKSLYADPTLGNTVLNLWLKPEAETEYFSPFIAFKLTARVRYVHQTGGI